MVELVCPRCRQGDNAQTLDIPDGLVGPSSPEFCDVHCPRCDAQYPVVDGVPILFRDPRAVLEALRDPWRGLPAHLLAQAATQARTIPDSLWRVGRYACAAFGDLLDEPLPAGLEALPPHAVSVMAEVETRSGYLGDGPVLVAGSALGREAWESSRATVLFDAHLPSLLAANHLALGEPLTVVRRTGPGAAEPVEIPSPGARRISAVCGDIHDPPFRAGTFPVVVASNLIDSVGRPRLALGQLAALSTAAVDAPAVVAVSSPWSWRDEITPRDEWLDGSPEGSRAQVLPALRAAVASLSDSGQATIPWWLWTDRGEAMLYRNLAAFAALGDP